MHIDVLILLIIKFVNQNNYLFKSYILIHKQEIKKYVIRFSFGSSKNFKNSFFYRTLLETVSVHICILMYLPRDNKICQSKQLFA